MTTFHWEKFKNYIAPLDIFGQKVDLTYKKEVVYRTIYGATFTFFIYIFIFLQVIEGYKELATRQNPAISIIEFEDINSSKIDLSNKSNNNISIAVNVISKTNRESNLDYRYFHLEAKYELNSKNYNDSTYKLNIPLTSCSIKDFKNFKNLYNNFNLSSSFCLRIPNNEEAVLYTDPDNFKESFLKIKLKVCTNSSYYNECKSNDEINQRFLDSSFFIYITHYYFDGTNMEQPINQRFSFESWDFEDLIIRRKDTMYLTSHKLMDYNGLFMNLNEPKPQHFVHYNERQITRNIKVKPDFYSTLFELNLKSHTIPIKITRKYKTFIDILGNIGGLFNIFALLGFFVFGYINKTFLEASMINDHFSITNHDIRPNIYKDIRQQKYQHNNELKDRESNYFRSSQSDIEKTLFNKSITNEHSLFKSPLLSKEQDKFLHNLNSKDIVDENEELEYNYQKDQRHKEKTEQMYNVDRICAHSLEDSTSKKPFHTVKIKKENLNEKNLKTHKHKNFYFSYNLSDFFMSLLFVQNKTLRRKNEIFRKCKRILDGYVDIKNLISLTQEFKIARSVIFDQVQLDIVNYYKKPVLKLDGQDVTMIYRKSIVSETQPDTCDINSKLDEINKRNNVIDHRLIEMINLEKNN